MNLFIAGMLAVLGLWSSLDGELGWAIFDFTAALANVGMAYMQLRKRDAASR